MYVIAVGVCPQLFRKFPLSAHKRYRHSIPFLPSPGILPTLNAVTQVAGEWRLPTEKELSPSPLCCVARIPAGPLRPGRAPALLPGPRPAALRREEAPAAPPCTRLGPPQRQREWPSHGTLLSTLCFSFLRLCNCFSWPKSRESVFLWPAWIILSAPWHGVEVIKTDEKQWGRPQGPGAGRSRVRGN